MQCRANSFAWIESDWSLRDGDKSLIGNFSCTKQSNLLWHFVRTENCLSRSVGTIQCLEWCHDDSEMFAFHVNFYLFVHCNAPVIWEETLLSNTCQGIDQPLNLYKQGCSLVMVGDPSYIYLWATRKSQFLYKIELLGTMDFKDSEAWLPKISSQITIQIEYNTLTIEAT